MEVGGGRGVDDGDSGEANGQGRGSGKDGQRREGKGGMDVGFGEREGKGHCVRRMGTGRVADGEGERESGGIHKGKFQRAGHLGKILVEGEGEEIGRT